MAAYTLDKDYLTALRSYWEGRPQTAIEHLSLAIAENPERQDRFMLYRLWIEVLADLGESATLASLSDHLHVLGMVNPTDASTYMALRGLIALESEQVTAALLYAKGTTEDRDKNFYCEELRYRLERRLTDRESNTTLAANVSHLEDYLHHVMVAQVAFLTEDEHLMVRLSKRTEKLYDKAPLHLYFQTHLAIEGEDFAQASYYALVLADLYPAQHEYSVLAGYALLKSGRTKEAVDLLERLVKSGGERDPDVTSILVSAHTQLHESSKDEHHERQSAHYETQTRQNLQELDMESLYSAVMPKDQPLGQSGDTMKPWLLKLNAREFHAMREKTTAQLETTRIRVSQTTQPGDVVFIAGDDYRGKDSWRLMAVVTVAEQPQFDPINGFEAIVKVVAKPEITIPFEVSIQDGKNLDHQLIDLNGEAMGHMADAIESFADADSSIYHALEEINKLRMSS